jgi:acyl-CoA thioester hydrolase
MNADPPSSGRFEGRAHFLAVRVYYEDTDFTGLVYHANYLRYFERGRSDFLRAAGVDHTMLAGVDTALTLTDIAVRYRKPARIDDALVVRTMFERVRGPRLDITQSLLRGGQTVAEAAVKACCISMTGRACRPPALLVDKLKPYLEAAASMF